MITVNINMHDYLLNQIEKRKTLYMDEALDQLISNIELTTSYIRSLSDAAAGEEDAPKFKCRNLNKFDNQINSLLEAVGFLKNLIEPLD